VATVQERLSERDLAGALAACERIATRPARAEWRFHVLHEGGDLAGALAAARDGLEEEPRHPGLLANAASSALALREGTLAERLTAALVEIEAAPGEPWPGFRERARSLRERALGELALERRAEREARRARIVSWVGLIAASLALFALARSGGTPR